MHGAEMLSSRRYPFLVRKDMRLSHFIFNFISNVGNENMCNNSNTVVNHLALRAAAHQLSSSYLKVLVDQDKIYFIPILFGLFSLLHVDFKWSFIRCWFKIVSEFTLLIERYLFCITLTALACVTGGKSNNIVYNASYKYNSSKRIVHSQRTRSHKPGHKIKIIGMLRYASSHKFSPILKVLGVFAGCHYKYN